jgi:ABC-type amino acid transport substrate-binding protein
MIEILEELLHRAKIDYELVPMDHIETGEALSAGTIDTIAQGAFHNYVNVFDRHWKITYPVTFAGQGVLCMAQLEPSFTEFMSSFLGSTAVTYFAGVLSMSIISAHFYWVLERESEDEMIAIDEYDRKMKKKDKKFRLHVNNRVRRGYFVGVYSDSLWWSVGTLTAVGFGDQVPKTRFGRLLSIIWTFVPLVMISSIIASMTTTRIIDNMEPTTVTSFSDLTGLRIGVLDSSFAQTYLERRGLGASIIKYPSFVEAFTSQLGGKVDVLAGPSDLLQYYSASEMSAGRTNMAALKFAEAPLGFPFSPSGDDAIIDKLNLNLLTFQSEFSKGSGFNYLIDTYLKGTVRLKNSLEPDNE